MHDTLNAILNNSENATLQYIIFCKKALDEKYLLKLNNVASDSSKLHQFVSFDVWVNSFLCLKLYSLNFAIAYAQKRLLGLYLCCINTQENLLTLETSSEINFEFFKFVKQNCKMSPLDKNK